MRFFSNVSNATAEGSEAGFAGTLKSFVCFTLFHHSFLRMSGHILKAPICHVVVLRTTFSRATNQLLPLPAEFQEVWIRNSTDNSLQNWAIHIKQITVIKCTLWSTNTAGINDEKHSHCLPATKTNAVRLLFGMLYVGYTGMFTACVDLLLVALFRRVSC